MQRRDAIRALLALGLPGTLTGCGGGGGSSSSGGAEIAQFSSDKPQYLVGESALLTAVFSGGTGRIEPGNIPITSGVPVTTSPLAGSRSVRLIVASSGGTVYRDLALSVGYRNTLQALSMGFARASHAAVEIEGKVFVIGGEDNNVSLPLEAMAFDPVTETFAVAGQTLSGRTQHTASPLPDGTVLIFGGSRMTPGSPIAERFNPRTGTSRATLSQPLASRSMHTATPLPDGRVVIIGGTGLAGNSIDVFDPQTEQFARLATTLQFRRQAHTATLLASGKILVFGGMNTAGGPLPPEVFDPATQGLAVLPLPSFETTSRHGHVALGLAGADIVIAGGETDAGAALATLVRVTQGMSIVPAGALQTPRNFHAGAPLTDGRVLIAGGGVSPGTDQPIVGIATTEIHSPATGATAAGPTMSSGRMLHTATLLGNGKVLIIGGFDGNRVVASTAELFG